jgi:hypothetical protein
MRLVDVRLTAVVSFVRGVAELAVLKILLKCALGPLLLADVTTPTRRFWACKHATQPLPLFIEYVTRDQAESCNCVACFTAFPL